MSNAYFFGCWAPNKKGHHLYGPSGEYLNVYRAQTPVRPEILDGGLLHDVPKDQGNAVLFHGRGWTILSFWDQSGDSRPGSNSTFLLWGRLQFDLAVETAKEAFPQRWSLIKFEVKEYKE